MRNRHFLLIDLILLPMAAVLAFVLRLDAQGVLRYRSQIILFVLLALPVKILVFRWLGLYSRFWRYASTEELVQIALATGLSLLIVTALLFAVALPLSGMTSFPRSVPFIDALLTLFAVGGPRFLVRMAHSRRTEDSRRGQQAERPVLIVGAGDAGAMIVKEMRANPQLGMIPVGFVDDDPLKQGVRIHGVPVLGARQRIPDLAREYGVAEIIIAMPTASGGAIREILAICSQAGVPVRTMPGLYDIIAGQVSVSQLRNVEIEDLLRREPVKIDSAAVHELIRGRRVLVTGGGGSIGSELCRQIARAEPESLILLGHGENSIFDIHGELAGWQIGKVIPIIADVRDKGRLQQLFERHRPDLVFHAAAHKHVPLMETNPCEAITNNVLGTRNLVQVAAAVGVSHLILISTDKAVNPTSVMGASKRVAELIVYQAARTNGRCFSAVRFGNVLGSRGSVIHVFKQQIARGGPITVTHPEMKRYFMTIPEAVQLVLQAAALGEGAEVFVLDMGEPVRIVDLATDLVQLSGLRPKVVGEDRPEEWDIEVRFSGQRPGEKLFEELFVDGEGYRRTRHDKIFVAMHGLGDGNAADLDRQIDWLIEMARQGDALGVRRTLRELVPEYQPYGFDD